MKLKNGRGIPCFPEVLWYPERHVHVLRRSEKDSYISKLTLQATKSKKGEQSEMIRSLNYLIMVMGIIIIPIGIALFVQSFIYNEGTFHDSITGMVAAIIGMIPEGRVSADKCGTCG